ncbi:Thiamine pyrophosphate-binding protein [Burkholderiales bacterium 8X]|nr:Thiamine pyrophosphate-binding protein [Burkholderiales bacterium 8X]
MNERPTPSSAAELRPRTGGQVVVDALRIHGVDTVFSVPGESFLPVLDALHEARDSIRLVTCRQEGNAAHMAEAHAKLRGVPGVCLVTRGPGSTNASIGIHTARQDSTPLVVLVGQVSRASVGREAWQELDYQAVFGPMTKWAVQVDRAERLPETLARAFQVASSGRAGPVVVALPEDLLYETMTVADTRAYSPVQANPGADDLDRLRELLAAARRPLLIVGGGGWSREACDDLARFAKRFDLPVGTGFRRQDLIDNHDPQFAGDVGIGINAALAKRVREADLIVALGTRLGETTTQDYSLVAAPCPAQILAHIHADVGELGRVYQPTLAIHSGMAAFCSAAAALPSLFQPGDAPWADWTAAARADYLATLAPPASTLALDMGAVMAHLREVLPADTIVTNGAGNYAAWVHRFYRYRGFRTQLAPTSGAMGYGVPAACAAALAHPDRCVVCFAGDGCFQMSMQELATAKQYDLRIVFIVVNNGIFGSIRMHQEMHYPGRVYGTAIENPDFAQLARAYGLHAEVVEATEDFAPAFERARAFQHAALIELRVDPEAITPRTTLTALREKALAERR